MVILKLVFLWTSLSSFNFFFHLQVTIVLFSRTFYETESLEYFPESMRACLQKDYRGKFYEDFYRVAVQSERMDDWACVLPQLKLLFHDWQNSVLGYHQQNHPEMNIPKVFFNYS